MTRDEEVITACKGFLSRYPSIDQAGLSIGFLDGAVWADKHPKNVWHDASEPPKLNKWFIYEAYAEDKDPEYGAYFSAELEPITWVRMTFANEITRWAYVSDLLPKRGEK